MITIIIFDDTNIINIIRRGWSLRRWRSCWPSSGSAPATSWSSPMCPGMLKLRWYNIIIKVIIITKIFLFQWAKLRETLALLPKGEVRIHIIPIIQVILRMLAFPENNSNGLVENVTVYNWPFSPSHSYDVYIIAMVRCILMSLKSTSNEG